MLDRIEIWAKGGEGGDGAISFRREKFIPFGGPDGGDGGDGGSVVIVADVGVGDFSAFRGKRIYRAARGGNGAGGKRHGRKGKDLLLPVPVGTMVRRQSPEGEAVLIADCKLPRQRVEVARGGRGGLGNTHFTSSTNQTPRIAQKGAKGEEEYILLELRLIADIGIIGYPNVGKSTLLAAVSAARPRIASYPFTTLEPILGVVAVGGDSFVLAEIPGLIAGAHLGRGLGHDFLQHIMRTRVLIHLVDGTSEAPVEDMAQVNAELGLFAAELAQKPQLVAVSKVDLPQVRERLSGIKKAFRQGGSPVFFVSAVAGRGVNELMTEALKMLRRFRLEEAAATAAPGAVFRPEPETAGAMVLREGDVFIITAPEVARIIGRVDMADPEVRRQLRGYLSRRGVTGALEKAGIAAGDRVRCGDVEWEW